MNFGAFRPSEALLAKRYTPTQVRYLRKLRAKQLASAQRRKARQLNEHPRPTPKKKNWIPDIADLPFRKDILPLIVERVKVHEQQAAAKKEEQKKAKDNNNKEGSNAPKESLDALD